MKTLFWWTQYALGVLFVGLKLTGHIDWHWAWVTAPFWLVLSIALTMIGLGKAMLWLAETPEERRIRKNKEAISKLLGIQL